MTTCWRVGSELGQIYGYVYDGFYKIEDFDYNYAISQWVPKAGVVNSNSMFGTTPGAPKYKNLVDNYENNPNDVNIINEADMTVIGNTNPRFGGVDSALTGYGKTSILRSSSTTFTSSTLIT